MALIGTFGRELDVSELEPDYFAFHGEHFTVPARVSALPIMRFAWATNAANGRSNTAQSAERRARTEADKIAAKKEQAAAEMDMLAALHVFLRDTIGEHQWEQFERLAQIHGDDIEEIMHVAQAIYATVVDRPTQRPSDSSDGPSTSGTGSPVPSVSEAPMAGPTSSAAAARAEIHGLLTPVADGIRSSA
jgi:hypothetical protein